jgi:hypothetical protein
VSASAASPAGHYLRAAGSAVAVAGFRRIVANPQSAVPRTEATVDFVSADLRWSIGLSQCRRRTRTFRIPDTMIRGCGQLRSSADTGSPRHLALPDIPPAAAVVMRTLRQRFRLEPSAGPSAAVRHRTRPEPARRQGPTERASAATGCCARQPQRLTRPRTESTAKPSSTGARMRSRICTRSPIGVSRGCGSRGSPTAVRALNDSASQNETRAAVASCGTTRTTVPPLGLMTGVLTAAVGGLEC